MAHSQVGDIVEALDLQVNTEGITVGAPLQYIVRKYLSWWGI
jgi:hypothetical protein